MGGINAEGSDMPDEENEGVLNDDALEDGLRDSNLQDFDADQNRVRPEIIEKVLRSLSADARRCGGSLKRADVDRTYIRRELSIAECAEVERTLVTSGVKIEDEEFSGNTYDTQHVDNEENFLPYRVHYLSENEEKQLGRKIQLALKLLEGEPALDPNYVRRVKKDAERAKAIFVETNMRYVHQLAKKRGHHQHMTLDDIKQEGALGLLRATESYDPEQGFRFKTYATWWIKQKMHRAVEDSNRIVRLPVHIQGTIRRIRRSERLLTLSTGKPPSLNELAEAVGMEPERIAKLRWLVNATNCLEADAPIGEGISQIELLPDTSDSAFDIVLDKELQSTFHDVLRTLTPREEKIVRMRFGIGLDREYTLESIGQIFKLTRERIRQIEKKALGKLRHAVRRKHLKDFMD